MLTFSQAGQGTQNTRDLQRLYRAWDSGDIGDSTFHAQIFSRYPQLDPSSRSSITMATPGQALPFSQLVKMVRRTEGASPLKGVARPTDNSDTRPSGGRLGSPRPERRHFQRSNSPELEQRNRRQSCIGDRIEWVERPPQRQEEIPFRTAKRIGERPHVECSIPHPIAWTAPEAPPKAPQTQQPDAGLGQTAGVQSGTSQVAPGSPTPQQRTRKMYWSSEQVPRASVSSLDLHRAEEFHASLQAQDRRPASPILPTRSAFHGAGGRPQSPLVSPRNVMLQEEERRGQTQKRHFEMPTERRPIPGPALQEDHAGKLTDNRERATPARVTAVSNNRRVRSPGSPRGIQLGGTQQLYHPLPGKEQRELAKVAADDQKMRSTR